MALSLFQSPLHAALLGDHQVGALLSDETEIAMMIRIEAALAKVQGRLGVIPQAAAAAIVAGLETITIAPETLAQGMGKDGVAAPALVAALRRSLPEEAAPFLHWGATSQDIADTALVLRLQAVFELFDARLDRLIVALAALARRHRATPCLARTRTQQAAPTLFGLKAAQWLAPLARHRQRLEDMRPRVLCCQSGGAVGTLAAMGEAGIGAMDALADDLGLARAVPWHKGRDGIAEAASLLAMISASLGMMGADMLALAQSEVSEIRFEGAGASSTLPQKQNPVLAEMLVALARYAASEMGGLYGAMIHQNERDGAAWMAESLSLPGLMLATGSALLRAEAALQTLVVDEARMTANLAATRGFVFAEAAGFALSAHMPRAEALALVKKALIEAEARGETLFDALARLSTAPVDWKALADPLQQLRPAQLLIDRMLAQTVIPDAA